MHHQDEPPIQLNSLVSAQLAGCLQSTSPSLQAFMVTIAAWLPWPESINTIYALAAGPIWEQERLASLFWDSVQQQDGKAEEILDDIAYRPWTRMPWLAAEFI